MLHKNTSIEVYKVLMGPMDVTIGATILTDVYMIDEFIAGEAIPGYPGKFYSSYWTELGLRANWITTNRTNGQYELSVELFNDLGAPVTTSTNDFADLNLYIMNTPLEGQIHEIQYDDAAGTTILTDANPCQTVILNHITPTTDDDNIQFLITAKHPYPEFFLDYTLSCYSGHDSFEWSIPNDINYKDNDIVETPATYTGYHSCAYRFHLHIRAKITNGYDRLYRKNNNWYVGISVVTP